MSVSLFSKDDSKKTKSQVISERNIVQAKVRKLREERDGISLRYQESVKTELEVLIGLLQTAQKSKTMRKAIKKAIWDYYYRNPRTVRVFTRKSTGEKTHRGFNDEGKECHLTVDGEYYKRWKKGDEPSFYLKPTLICPDNFTLEDDGNLTPIKLY